MTVIVDFLDERIDSIKMEGTKTKEDRKFQMKVGRAYSAWNNGYSTDEISEMTGLSIEKIEKLIPAFEQLKEKRSKEMK